MSEHHATIDWKRVTPDFAYETYNRDHDWQFDAGVTVRASANPAYLGSEDCVDLHFGHLVVSEDSPAERRQPSRIGMVQ